MKKDLLIVGILFVAAAIGFGVVIGLPSLNRDDEVKKTMLPEPEPIAIAPKPPIKKAIPPKKKPTEKKSDPDAKKEDVVARPPEPETKKSEDEPKIDPKKLKEDVPKVIAKEQPKIDPKKTPVAKVVILGETVRLKDPDGEYTVNTLNQGSKAVLVGTIKTLKIAGLNEKSELDATLLEADEVVFTGNINSGSRVLLGKTRSLKVRDVNGQSLLDATAASADVVRLEGALSSGSTVKVQAAGGSVELLGDVNGEIKLEIHARDVTFRGAVNGPQTQVAVTLSKDGSLKFRRVNGGVRFLYGKAAPGDPPLRIERGEVAPQAQFSELRPQ
jgi:hypothetical protein